MKIYISGRITGLNKQIATERFEAREKIIRDLGHEPVNPMKIPAWVEHPTWIDNLKKDITELVKCDAIYMIVGFKDSKGATLEHKIACELNLKIIYEKDNAFNTMPKLF